MLREFQLKNFKAFADTGSLPLRPITLIYGPNSAGKSSIIQSLMLLKQTLEEAEDSEIALLPKGKLADLGSYREFIHRHDISRNFAVKFQLDINIDNITPPEKLDKASENESDILPRVYKFLYGELMEYPYLSIELEFSVESFRSDISLQKINFWLGQDDSPVLTYETSEDHLRISQLHPEHSFWQYWWGEYKDILPGRIFKTINSTLNKHELKNISRRNLRDTVNELKNRQEVLAKQLEPLSEITRTLKRDLQNIETERARLETEEREVRLSQEDAEGEIERSKEEIKQSLTTRIKLRLQSEFDAFLREPESHQGFISDLESHFGNIPEHIQDQFPELHRFLRTPASQISKEEKKKIERQQDDVKQRVIESTVIGRLEDVMKSFVESIKWGGFNTSLEHQSIQNGLRAEEREELNSFYRLVQQLKTLRDKHEDEREPFRQQETIIENKEKEIQDQIKDNQSQANRLSTRIQRLDYLIEVWQSLSDSNLEKVLASYKKIADSILKIKVENFLPLEELNDFSYLNFPDLAFEVDVLRDIFEDVNVFKFLIKESLHTSELLNNILSGAQYVGPMRDYPKRFYIFSGSSTKKVGKSGTGTSDLLFRDPDFLQKVNNMLREFEIGHQIKIVSFTDKSDNSESDVYAIRLIDDRLKVDVSLLDVGFGVSQVLPVIIQSMFAKKQTILIEQPEVHIHPRLQTKLGNLFIDSVKENHNRFIVETHSEHLMLRLQRRIREGEISPDLISVLYVDRDEDGSICLELRLDEEGDFIDEWPDGFFDESFQEMF